jgi:type I restriction enzyme R subunit
LQAFSRTNRILNSVKTYGNIVCFRDLEKATQDAISLFGNKEAGGIVLLKPFAEYYENYRVALGELTQEFDPGVLPAGEENQKTFVELYNRMLRLKNILQSFDEFEGNQIISDRDLQDYQSAYLRIYSSRGERDKESILQDVLFEIELIKQVEINVDYILLLVQKLKDSKGDQSQDKELLASIDRAVSSSLTLRSKKDLIDQFIASMNVGSDVQSSWRDFMSDQKKIELEEIIQDERLDVPSAHLFMDQAFRDGELQIAGPALSRMLPPKSMFSESNEHGEQKLRVLTRLQKFFERFVSIS